MKTRRNDVSPEQLRADQARARASQLWRLAYDSSILGTLKKKLGPRTWLVELREKIGNKAAKKAAKRVRRAEREILQ